MARISLLIVFLPFGLALAAEPVMASVTIETCTSGSAIVIQGEGCYVQDLAKREGAWVLSMKFGPSVGAKLDGLGAEASLNFVVTLTIPSSRAANAEQARSFLATNATEVAQAIRDATKNDPTPEAVLKDWVRQNSCPK